MNKNQRFVYGLNKNLKKPLLLKLEVSFDQLIDIALRLEEADKESDVEVMGAKPNFNNKKRPSKFKGHYPNKKQRLLPLVVGNATIMVLGTIMRTSVQSLVLVAIAKARIIIYLLVPNFKARGRESLMLLKSLATHLVVKVFFILSLMALFYFVITLFEFFLKRVRPILLFQKNLLIIFLWMFCV